MLFSAMTLFCQNRSREIQFTLLLNFLSSQFFFLFLCVFLSFLFAHFLPDLSPAHFLCQYVCLPQRESQLRGTQDWRQTLAVIMFMEVENYTVTFPAFLLEISNRSGLSIPGRDPGGGEMGCNHFLSHHFLHVD